jgi:hypothetical protein
MWYVGMESSDKQMRQGCCLAQSKGDASLINPEIENGCSAFLILLSSDAQTNNIPLWAYPTMILQMWF